MSDIQLFSSKHLQQKQHHQASADPPPRSTNAAAAQPHAANSAKPTPVNHNNNVHQTYRNELPALKKLLQTLQPTATIVQTLQTAISNLQQQLTDHKLPTKDGMSYLDLRTHLLLTYNTLLLQYICLKTSTTTTDEQLQRVISQLCYFHLIYNRLKPIDKKLQYSIDKAVRSTNRTVKDELSYKPNIDAMMSSSDNGSTSSASSVMDSKLKKLDDASESAELYRAPKMSATHFDEDRSESAKERAAARRPRTHLSAEMSDTLNEMVNSDAPEQHVYGDASKMHRTDAERQRFEEDNFIRLNTTKTDKKRQRSHQRQQMDAFHFNDSFNDLYDSNKKRSKSSGDGFDDLAMPTVGNGKKQKGSNAASDIMNDSGMSSSKKRRELQKMGTSVDEQMDKQASKGIRPTKQQMQQAKKFKAKGKGKKR